MIPHAPKRDLFTHQLRCALERVTKDCRTVQIPKHAHVYTSGDKCRNVYFIKNGHVKLLMVTRGGKECLLDIYTSGDVFGEQCLSHLGERLETAVAMEESLVWRIPRSQFLSRVREDSLLEDFVEYLALRIADQKEVITNLVTINSEIRLAKTLLKLAVKLGKKHRRSTIIQHKITQTELSEMVGTTRSRVCRFMRRFQQRDLIVMNSSDHIIVNENNLTNYMNQFN